MDCTMTNIEGDDNGNANILLRLRLNGKEKEQTPVTPAIISTQCVSTGRCVM